MSNANLKLQLQAALTEVRLQQEVVLAYHRDKGENPYAMMNPNGEFVLAPYISAKTQLLCALASLEAK